MIDHVYGSTTNGIHSDTSRTERGAKIYATRNGLDNVSIRYNAGYRVRIIAIKKDGKWSDPEDCPEWFD